MKIFHINNLAIPLMGLLAIVIFINLTPHSPTKNGKTLSEYMQMNIDDQRLYVLESRRALFHSYLNHNDIERASCVARLFDAKTEHGNNEFNKIETLLRIEANQSPDQITDEVAMRFINTNFCPLNGLLADQ